MRHWAIKMDQNRNKWKRCRGITVNLTLCGLWGVSSCSISHGRSQNLSERAETFSWFPRKCWSKGEIARSLDLSSEDEEGGCEWEYPPPHRRLHSQGHYNTPQFLNILNAPLAYGVWPPLIRRKNYLKEHNKAGIFHYIMMKASYLVEQNKNRHPCHFSPRM